ncbi:WXG100-like domain-containing protein [Parasphingorhabdus pacifica]
MSALADAQAKSTELESKIQEFFDQVNDVLSWVPDMFSHLIEPIQQGMREFREKVKEFWAELSQFWKQPGDADGLKQIADQWSNSVSSSIADIVGDIGINNMRANVEWEGRAAEAYKALIPTQSDGLNGIKGIADQLNSSLHSLGDSIDSFWLTITCALAAFAVAIFGAIASAFTVAGLPAGIAVVTTVVAANIALITTAITSLNSHLDKIDSEQRSLKQAIDGLGDQWEKSGTEMTDATTSDGDASDWRVNA